MPFDSRSPLFALPRQKLLAEYLLDGNTLDTNDGSKTAGSVTSVGYANCNWGYQKQCADLTGNGFLDVGDRWSGSGSLSIMVDCVPDVAATSGDYNVIFRYSDSSGFDSMRVYYGGYGNNTMQWKYSTGTPADANNTFTITEPFVAGRKYKMEFELDDVAKRARFYLDGVLHSEQIFTGSVSKCNKASQKLSFGNKWFLANEGWDGHFGSIRMFSTLLTSLERSAYQAEFNRQMGGGSDFGAVIPAPVAHWPLDGQAGNVATGAVASLLNSPTAATDRFGSAFGYVLNGSNQAVSITESISTGGNTYTIYGWLKYTGTPSGDRKFLYFSNNGNPEVALAWEALNSKMIGYVYNGSTTTKVQATANFNDDAWHFWQFVCNGTTGTLYVDGVANGTGTINAITFSGFAKNAIGRQENVAAQYFPGSVQECGVLGVALTADQAKLHYQTFARSYPYAFRRSIINAIRTDSSTKFLIANGVDISGNGNNPTYVGTPVAARAQQNDTKSYDGSTMYGYVTDTSANFVAGLSTMTAACWFKGTASGSMMIYAHWEWGPWLIKKNGSNQLEVLVRTGGVNTTVTTSKVINDGNWHHLGLVYDGANIKVYLDGYLLQTQAKTGTLTHSTGGSPAYVMFASNRQTGPTYTEKLNGLTDGQFLSARAYSGTEMQMLRISTYRQ